MGESKEKPYRPADVAEPIRVFILDYFAYELRAAPAELLLRLVEYRLYLHPIVLGRGKPFFATLGPGSAL